MQVSSVKLSNRSIQPHLRHERSCCLTLGVVTLVPVEFVCTSVRKFESLALSSCEATVCSSVLARPDSILVARGTVWAASSFEFPSFSGSSGRSDEKGSTLTKHWQEP